jgi:hypothetical protein
MLRKDISDSKCIKRGSISSHSRARVEAIEGQEVKEKDEHRDTENTEDHREKL